MHKQSYNQIDDRTYCIARLAADRLGVSVADTWAKCWLYSNKAAVKRMLVGAILYNKEQTCSN